MRIRTFSSFIIKIQNPCINCVNYIKYKYPYPEDELYDYETKLGKCSLFGNQNLVTGETEYEQAIVCRKNDSKCGKEGKYYNEKNLK